MFRSGRGRKLSGDQITLPTTVDFSQSAPKQVSVAFKEHTQFKVCSLKLPTGEEMHTYYVFSLFGFFNKMCFISHC